MKESPRYVCIHGHFYQPPRENPWLDVVEVQESAAPYHDWNERVTAECYEPNAAARVLDERGRIVKLRHNYAAISFNFGPTLLAWMEVSHPELYARILEADRLGVQRYGRGNAIAQAYGHAILPLADARDKVTQVRWGIADFAYRFGRHPEGMWLPETAVDEDTLRVLAEHQIRFTILAPHQARRVSYDGGVWQELHGEGIDPSRPYRCELEGGRSITVFFYDGPLARGIAFEGWLRDGRALAEKIVARCHGMHAGSLLSVAADGETYGHHHRFGDMALAAALDALEARDDVRLINYASYLQAAAVRDRVEIRPWTSWSCAHGIERWRSGCPCHAGHPEWQHDWRAVLRESLVWLKQELDNLFEQVGERWFPDPWEARNAYIEVLLDPRSERRDAFVRRFAPRATTPGARVAVWKLLELQRNALLMFTSCGWFFDDPSGLETTQILAYAARAMQLGAEFGPALDTGFRQRLHAMRSNLPRYSDGVEIFDRLVWPRASDHRRVVAHYAMNALFDPPPALQRSYVYRLLSKERTFDTGGSVSFVAGKVEVTEEHTEDSGTFDYGAVHLGGHDFLCFVDAAQPTRDAAWRQRLLTMFRTQPLADVLRELETRLSGWRFTLADVFAAERRQILSRVTADVLARAGQGYERIVSENRRLIEFLVHHGLEIPEELRMAMVFVVRRLWERRVREFAAENAELDELLAVAEEGRRWGVELEKSTAARVWGEALAEAVTEIASDGGLGAYRRALHLIEAASRVGVAVDMRKAQDRFFHLRQQPPVRASSVGPELLRALGKALGFALDADA